MQGQEPKQVFVAVDSTQNKLPAMYIWQDGYNCIFFVWQTLLLVFPLK